MPIAYLMAAQTGGFALIISKQGVHEFPLPGLNEDSLRVQIYGKANKPAQGGYLQANKNWRNNPAKEKNRIAWFNALDEATGWLWDAGIGELITHLKEESESVMLIPTGNLAILPLHAAWTEDKSRPSGRRYGLDELNITYAPSAHALWQASLASERPVDSILVVDNPDGTLSFSGDEVQAALDVFKQAKHLQGKKATMKAVKSEMQNAHVLHFSTHGMASWDEAVQARLLLADGDLTLSDIFKLDLSQTRQAVLSACETGVPGLKLIEEMIGLPSGMMQAGVPGVIGSLWSVSDMSTAMLMARFYSLWKEKNNSPQEALRQAQIWLRDSTTEQKKDYFSREMEMQTVRMGLDTAQAFYQSIGWNDPGARVFESPFYWAAFTYTGI